MTIENPVRFDRLRVVAGIIKQHAAKADYDGDKELTAVEVQSYGESMDDNFVMGAALKSVLDASPAQLTVVKQRIGEAVAAIEAVDENDNKRIDTEAELAAANNLTLFGDVRTLLDETAVAASAIETALYPLEIPDNALCARVDLADVPVHIQQSLLWGASEIENRSFSGTDYQAEVDGYYVVYKSETDPTIVGYAVQGFGAGEPDYHDGIVYGFDVRGDQVLRNVESG